MISNYSNSFIVRQMRPKRRNTFVTVAILGCIIGVFLLAYHSFGTETNVESTIVQINVIFRHGERTPNSTYPTDPHKNHEWEAGYGALTNEGKYRMFLFGETIRKMYGEFLGNLYNPNDVSILSSYAPRCQMSAMTFLAGLFPPVESQIWNKDLLWQPIPVNPIPRDKDNLLVARASCPSFSKEKLKSDEELFGNLTDSQKDTIVYLNEKTGKFVNKVEDVEFLYSIFKIQEDHGLELPHWTKKVYPEPMKSMAAMNLACYTRTNKLKILRGGPLVKKLLENMELVEKKAHFYSGHDVTIVNLMRTLGFDVEFLPDFGAAFVFELHHTRSDRIVKAFYYNSSISVSPLRLHLPGCETNDCPLETLNKHLTPYIPQDWAKECQITQSS